MTVDIHLPLNSTLNALVRPSWELVRFHLQKDAHWKLAQKKPLANAQLQPEVMAGILRQPLQKDVIKLGEAFDLNKRTLMAFSHVSLPSATGP